MACNPEYHIYQLLFVAALDYTLAISFQARKYEHELAMGA